MQVERAHAPATHLHGGATYYFCSDRCHEKFTNDPENYINQPGTATGATGASKGADKDTAVDPVCGMEVDTARPAAAHVHDGTR